MSITKSYNKQTGIYYAYETIYEWSDEKQKKVQRKRCIGQFDPETGEVVPNGKVGRPALPKQKKNRLDTVVSKSETGFNTIDSANVIPRLAALEEKARILSDEIHELIVDVNNLSSIKG